MSISGLGADTPENPPHLLGFRDADFRYSFFPVKSSDGRVTKRWLPFGMPRLNPFVSRAVFFLYGITPGTTDYEVQGTGFIVGLPYEKKLPYIHHYYAVTCQHVLTSGGHDLRVNTKDGKSRPIEISIDQWDVSPSHDDLAAVDITDQINLIGDDVSAIPEHLLLDEKFAGLIELGIGEDGFMVGLFSNKPGKGRNLIAARFGNIALLANKDEPIKHANGAIRPAHIFDIHSRPGFSGSPVFVYRTPANDLRDITYGPDLLNDFAPDDIRAHLTEELRRQHHLQENMFLRVLGMHSGQYNDRVEVRPVIGGGKHGPTQIMDAPNSMTVVVPSWEISKFLTEFPPFKEQRHKREEMEDKDGEPSAKPESAAPPPPANSAATVPDDPHHKERFTALLGAAATKKPQGG